MSPPHCLAGSFISAALPWMLYNPHMERLNKYLAHAGVGSRRHCDDLIASGRVKIDGRRVIDLGIKVDPETQKISVDDQPVRAEQLVYWAVNKPPGYLCTNEDPDGRPRAVDLIPHVNQRVYTVGRLDEASEGLLLMTNDGELAYALMHPRFQIEKTYQVLVAGKPGPLDLQKLLDGVWLSDGRVRARQVRRMKPQGDGTWLRIVLSEGKNREIRRMLAKLGHKVLKLKRIAIGPILLDRLPKAKSRRLSRAEVESLQKLVTSATKRVEHSARKARGEVTDEMPSAASVPGKRGSAPGAARPRKGRPGEPPRPPRSSMPPRPRRPRG